MWPVLSRRVSGLSLVFCGLLFVLVRGARFPDAKLLRGNVVDPPLLERLVSHSAKPLKAAAGGPHGSDAVQTVFTPESVKWLPKLKEPSSMQFDLDKAVLFGRLTSVAYCHDVVQVEAWNCTRCAEVPHLQNVTVVFDPLWDLLAYVGYLPDAQSIVVVFRGTDSSSLYNWMDNLRAWRTDHMYPMPQAPHAKIHSGFYLLWSASSLQSTITTLVGNLLVKFPKARLYAAGHSMGGALAQLCAIDFKFYYNFTEVYVYTFGAPRLGNIEFAALFVNSTTEAWRLTHNRDIVPSLPFMMMGFHHAAREVWQVDMQNGTATVETKLLVCDESGEDPACHNSACYLGICTNVADHLVYLGIHLYHDLAEC